MNQRRIPEPSAMLNNLRLALRDTSAECSHHTSELMELADLEAKGRSDDNDPRFAALFAHMDGCVSCTEEYAALVGSLRNHEASVAVAATRAFPVFFAAPTTIRRQDTLILKIWEGVRRKLDLELPSAAMAQKVAVMSGENLFSSQVTELSGQPFFTVSAQRAGDAATVRVAIVDVQRGAWEVRLTAGEFMGSQITNQAGVAEFGHVPLAAVAAGLRVVCEEQTG